jgi:enterobactin synthetase component D / holo-[acyl-carrier protein] synthase
MVGEFGTDWRSVTSWLACPGAIWRDAIGRLDRAPAFSHERQALDGAVEKRRREFEAGRRCAREAMTVLGIGPVVVGVGSYGAPIWPAGVVGSITHCAGYCAAAVARRTNVTAIGIDAEPARSLSPDLLQQIACQEERGHLSLLEKRCPSIRWDRLLFSAKEAVFKALFPSVQRLGSFDDAVVRFNPKAGRFSADLRQSVRFGESPPTTVVEGRWAAARELVLTAVVVPVPNLSRTEKGAAAITAAAR